MNLFASFAVNNLLWIIWYRVVLKDTEILQASGVSLKLRKPEAH